MKRILRSNRISQLREKYSISKAELAQKLGVHLRTVNNYESGETLPKAKDLLVMSKLFKVSIDFILDNESIEEQNTEIFNPFWGEILWENSTRKEINDLAEMLDFDTLKLKSLYYMLKAKFKNERAEALKSAFNLNV
ncbi:helix-turn-helix domain-containing protein [Flammeovirga yaeyamensis]|uniref:Helix-turn-helix domain-containing protein n=1 Tax=Flammeovirga yaeyamensis TaxID=367791 RepID=A0AAX1N3V5_9BACT|nr:helix-turn-helix transcriptional regulator [Flammeovirga yaeyamensis]MBB3695971.1 transcriptional regulator with XRE-family HTH domain [Flammeovirga yaeyamensis]NMF34658.1 helix-turn-helix transcriptional regulator [Flammeovirga yaeyamensis]QWG00513.1 helix-turn-helix domain-containing protein [Flammeovirga yaeyamensis]